MEGLSSKSNSPSFSRTKTKTSTFLLAIFFFFFFPIHLTVKLAFGTIFLIEMLFVTSWGLACTKIKTCYYSLLFQHFLVGDPYLPSGLQGLERREGVPNCLDLIGASSELCKGSILCIQVGSSLGNSSHKVIGISCPC